MVTLAHGIYKPAHRIEFTLSIMEHNLRMFKPVLQMTNLKSQPCFIPGGYIMKTSDIPQLTNFNLRNFYKEKET